MVNLYASLNHTIFNDRQKAKAFADGLSNNIHLRQLHVRHRLMNQMARTALMNGIRMKVGFHEVRVNSSSREEQSRLRDFMHQNRTVAHMTTRAESIGAVSLPTLLHALDDVSLHKQLLRFYVIIMRRFLPKSIQRVTKQAQNHDDSKKRNVVVHVIDGICVVLISHHFPNSK